MHIVSILTIIEVVNNNCIKNINMFTYITSIQTTYSRIKNKTLEFSYKTISLESDF